MFLKEPLKDGLKETTDFAKIYVLSHFDRLEGYDLIQKRRHDGKISGVFASRSPKRPKSIGLKLLELLAIKLNMLTVRGLDVIDGIPVLDIKPFIEIDVAGDCLRSP
ncbi:TrmO family methyltransferase domain-containing protein [Methanomethylovorans hollandica]|uniref:TrmO family methyltransferase domain-containing protein n=1 Tax=Methanomethylovorans hollandica TaxID=101192 RepID=UPI00247FD4FA|nr:TrmO family methyltransferase [Methanomethylovorans hollandica]